MKDMSSRDRLLALGVVFLWGLNFVAIHLALEHFPPLFLAALRFAVMALPVIAFVRFPKVRLTWFLLYVAGFGTVQFICLFLAMDLGMPQAWPRWSCRPRPPSPSSSACCSSVSG